MKDMIGLDWIRKEDMKQEFIKNDKPLVLLTVYRNKRYGAIAEVKQVRTPLEDFFRDKRERWNKMTEKQKKKAIDSDKAWEKKMNDPNYRVDTSDWKKPTDEDRRRLIALFAFELAVTKEDWFKRDMLTGRIQALLWDTCEQHPPRCKHSSWGNYVLLGLGGEHTTVDAIIEVLKGTEKNPAKEKLFHAIKSKGKFKYDSDWGRKAYQAWLARCQKNMIKVVG